MLFDLRGRGRRRTVQTVYIGLALLLGVGLIGFGIGGGFGGGGLLNAASNNEGSGGTSYASQIKRLQKLTGQQPNNIGAWERLTSAQLHEAGGEAYVSNGGPPAQGRRPPWRCCRSWWLRNPTTRPTTRCSRSTPTRRTTCASATWPRPRPSSLRRPNSARASRQSSKRRRRAPREAKP